MKHLLSAHIGVGVRQPATKETLDHLQQANIEVFNAMMVSAIGTSYDPTKIYVLYGLQLQIGVPSGGLQTITPGAVFCNGEVYLCQGTIGSYPLPGGSVWVANKTTSYYSGANPDPITFSDGSTANVHQSLTLDFAASASGSGTFNGGASVNNDYTKLVNISDIFVVAATLTGTYTMERNQNVIYSGVSSSNTITIDTANIALNKTLYFNGLVNSGQTIAFAGTSCTFINQTGSASLTASNTTYWVIKIKFLGRTGGGTYMFNVEVYNPA